MSVYACGSSKFGQLGIPNETGDRVDPVVIAALKGKRITSVHCGEAHSVAITEFGDVYTWGRGKEGQLGHGDKTSTPVPTHVEGLTHERIVNAACGNYHTIALTDTGKVYTWGKIHRLLDEDQRAGTQYIGAGVVMPGLGVKDMLDKSHMQYLAAGTTQDEDQMQMGKDFGRFANMLQDTPLLVESLQGKRVIAVAAGHSFSAAITDAGHLYTWGYNEKGQLGLGHRFNSEIPRLVHTLQGVRLVGVACGAHHTVVVDENGHMYTCGFGVFGQLGHGNLKDIFVPQRVETFLEEGASIVQVACGNFHTAARTSKGEMYSFGHGEFGQHGGSANYSDLSAGAKAGKDAHLFHSIPRLVEEFKGVKLNHIACGQLNSLAINENNQIYTWGWGASGCLGHGDKRYQLAPKMVNALQGEEISHAAVGWKHTLVVKSGTISTFAFDFKPVLNDTRYSDITLIVQGKEIYAHKVILCARCPYFRRIFLMHARFIGNGQMPTTYTFKNTEKYPIFMAFLLYLYTDHVIIPPHLIRELAVMAKKYGQPRLEALCNRATYRAWRAQGLGVDLTIPASTFAVEMQEAVNSRLFSDLSFSVSGETVYAHRVILAARCPYFQRMFEGNFKERDQAVFTIDDGTCVNSFVAMLSFLYTGEESLVQHDNVVELLSLADRFMIEDLKQLCEYYLERTVASSYISLIGLCEDENDEEVREACDSTASLLEIGDRFVARRLKRVCLETMCSSGEKNWRLISSSPHFASLRTTSPQLLREIDYMASKHGLASANSLFRGGVRV